MIQAKIAINALSMAGIHNAKLSAFACHDPTEAPYKHVYENGFRWDLGDRWGYITGGYRVTEMVRGKQKILPFGGVVFVFDPVVKKNLPVTHPLERAYSDLRFSEYGIG